MPEMDLRQIDALVAEKVMGWPWRILGGKRFLALPDMEGFELARGDEEIHSAAFNLVPPFSSDIAAAWQVVEELRARGIYIDINTAADFYQAVVFNHEGDDIAGCAHPSAPLAISLAALRAVGVEVPEDAV